MKNFKKSLLLSVSVAFMTFLFLPANASSLIEQQQQQLKSLEPTWTGHSSGSVRASGNSSVPMVIRNVDFNFTDGIGFHIENLTASFEPLNRTEPVNLDDPRQFIIHVHSGTVVLSSESLTNLFNKQVLDYWCRPLNNMRICTAIDTLIVRSGLRLWSWLPPMGWIPAYLKGQVVLSRDGKLVFTPYDVRALGIPIRGLLQTLGIKLSSLLTLNRSGAHLVGNSLILDPLNIFPPPALEGTVTAMKLDDAGLHLTFGDNVGATFASPASAPTSFIWIQSGDIKLFDIVVLNADVLMKKENNNVVLFDLYNYRKMIGAKNVLKMKEDGSMVLEL